MRPDLPVESILRMLSPCSSSPISRVVPLGALMTIMDLVVSPWFMVLQMLSMSSWVMQWYSLMASFSKKSLLISAFILWMLSSSRFSSSPISSIFFFISVISRSTSGSSFPPIHLIVFFWIFSTQLMPSSTLVMSQMRRFCTLSCSTATLRSIVAFQLFLMRSMNFLVSTESELSCRPLPSLWSLLLSSSSSSSTWSSSSSTLSCSFFTIRFPINQYYNNHLATLYLACCNRVSSPLSSAAPADQASNQSKDPSLKWAFLHPVSGFQNGAIKVQKVTSKSHNRKTSNFLLHPHSHPNRLIIIIMGSLLVKNKKQTHPSKESISEPDSAGQSQSQSQGDSHSGRVRPVPTILTREKTELLFKNLSKNKRLAIEKSVQVETLIQNQEWIINPEIIQHLRLINALQHIEVSAARVLQITLVDQNIHLICNHIQLESARHELTQSTHNQTSVAQEYAIIYADLFHIKFANLKKLKLQGPKSKSLFGISSLEPVSMIYAPLLEEFTADNHPITNVRFLRRCHWPFLGKLSLKGNAIIDSQEVGRIMSGLVSSRHLQSVDISGLYSGEWEVSWIGKMGFRDAQEESERLENDDQYWHRFSNRHLRRVDCGVTKNVFRGRHVRMLQRKFNNSYFDNPIVFW